MDYYEFLDKWKNLIDGNVPDFQPYSDILENLTEYWNKHIGNFGCCNKKFESDLTFDIPGIKVYDLIYNLWKDFENPHDFVANFDKKTNDIFIVFGAKIFSNKYTPECFSDINKLMDFCVTFYNYLAKPIIKIDETILDGIESKDLSSYAKFFKIFNTNYALFEKYFIIKGFGADREFNIAYREAINAFVIFIFSYCELFSFTLYKFQNIKYSLIDEYNNYLDKSDAINTFDGFYKLYVNFAENELVKLFYTDEYTDLCTNFSTSSNQFIIKVKKVFENNLLYLPLAFETDMRTLYKTVYDLQKEVRNLKNELSILKSEKEHING